MQNIDKENIGIWNNHLDEDVDVNYVFMEEKPN